MLRGMAAPVCIDILVYFVSAVSEIVLLWGNLRKKVYPVIIQERIAAPKPPKGRDGAIGF